MVIKHGGDVAKAWAEFSSHGFWSFVYAADEVIAEGLAIKKIAAYLGGVSPQQVGASTKYMNGWRTPPTIP